MVVPAVGYICPSHIRSESVEGWFPGPQTLVSLLPEVLVVLRRRGVPDAGAHIGVTRLYFAEDGPQSSFAFCRNAHQNPAPPAQEVDTAGQDHPAVALLFVALRDAP